MGGATLGKPSSHAISAQATTARCAESVGRDGGNRASGAARSGSNRRRRRGALPARLPQSIPEPTSQTRGGTLQSCIDRTWCKKRRNTQAYAIATEWRLMKKWHDHTAQEAAWGEGATARDERRGGQGRGCARKSCHTARLEKGWRQPCLQLKSSSRGTSRDTSMTTSQGLHGCRNLSLPNQPTPVLQHRYDLQQANGQAETLQTSPTQVCSPILPTPSLAITPKTS